MDNPQVLPTPPILSNARRARNTIILFKIMIVVLIINIVLSLFTLPHTPHNEVPNVVVVTTKTAGIMMFGLRIIFLTVFIMWMRRAYHNLHKSGIKHLRYHESWAASSWFVPGINVVRPRTIMKEIWNETQQAFYKNPHPDKRKDTIIDHWWGFYLLAAASGITAAIFLKVELLEAGYFLTLGSNLSASVAALVGTKMVKELAAMESEMHHRAAAFYGQPISTH